MSFWKKNILITGATGLLGGHLSQKLISEGANVIAIVRDSVPNSYFHLEGLDKKVTVVHGSLEDYFLVERAMNEYEIEMCFHMGAQTIVGTANRSPLSTFEANVRGTWNVLEAARMSSLLKSVVVASTDKAYGLSKLPYKEEDKLEASHPYDVSKACADMIAKSYFHTYGLPVGITRCGNIFGGGDLNYNRIIPGTIKSLISGDMPLIRSDGKMIRDYVYVKDIVDGYLSIAQAVYEGREKGEAFNFSYEKPMSVLEIYGKVCDAFGKKVAPKVLNQASNEILEQYLSSEKARKRLNWKPSYDIELGLEETIKWYRAYLK